MPCHLWSAGAGRGVRHQHAGCTRLRYRPWPDHVSACNLSRLLVLLYSSTSACRDDRCPSASGEIQSAGTRSRRIQQTCRP
ncbi:hypothetical protein PAHAL_3G181200 [Panicum hallii]|uniref:Uncharacterized protein n=1 Tax=Panicum hallii TaxID=206008 RepID=A0A2T8KIM0_9POAL|nr:hypothetical protein PAHAL_3G181200 [Panicum hallii]